MIRMMLAEHRQGSPQIQGALADALGVDAGTVFPRTERENIRAEMFTRTPTRGRKRKGLEVVHSYAGEVEDVAGW